MKNKNMFADNPDFYPTPRAVARLMLSRITNHEAKYFLEPSAGKGDIADVIKNPCTPEEFEAEHRDTTARYNGYRWSSDSRVHIDVVENYPDLIQVLRGKEYDVVGYDWLTYQGVRRHCNESAFQRRRAPSLEGMGIPPPRRNRLPAQRRNH